MRVEETLERTHQLELRRRKLDRQPLALELSESVLGRNGAAEREHGRYRFTDCDVDPRQIVGVLGDEVFMRMPVARMTVAHRRRDTLRVGGATSRVERFGEPTVRNGPIG